MDVLRKKLVQYSTEYIKDRRHVSMVASSYTPQSCTFSCAGLLGGMVVNFEMSRESLRIIVYS